MSERFPTQPRTARCRVADDLSAIGSRLARARRRRIAKEEVTRQSRPIHRFFRLLPSAATKSVTSRSAVPYQRRACETPVRDLAIKVILLHV